MILQHRKTKTVCAAEVFVNAGEKENLPVDCPFVISNGQELDPDDWEILFVTTEEKAILPDWWRDSISKDTAVILPMADYGRTGDRRL